MSIGPWDKNGPGWPFPSSPQQPKPASKPADHKAPYGLDRVRAPDARPTPKPID